MSDERSDAAKRDIIATGPHRCQLCNIPVTVLYDHQAKWAYAQECGHTIVPKHLRLTQKDRDGLIRFKVRRVLWDGFCPRPHRTREEMGHGE